MRNAEELRTILTRIIKNHKLYGCSFTYGVALRMGIVNQLFPDELDQLITDTIEDIYNDALDVMGDAGMRVDMIAIAHVIDIAVLDEVARRFIDEED